MNANAVSKRRQGPRTRDDQVGQPPGALDGHGVGVEWGAVATCEGLELLVSSALWWRWEACAAHGDGGGGAQVTHGPWAVFRHGRVTPGRSAQRGIRHLPARERPWAQGLGEAARCTSGPVKHAVGEVGSPPPGLPALVSRRREHRVTGVGARPERRSLEAIGPNANGSRQTH